MPIRPALAAPLLLLLLAAANTAQAAKVTQASPQGEVREARQVRLVFDTAVVRFGDPQLADPVKVQCEPAAALGRGRWTGDREWVLDLPSPLPAGTRCEVQRLPNWQPSQGSWDGPLRQWFSTGGPAVLNATPWEGAEIEENGWFLLRLSGAPVPATVAAKAWCEVEGLGERIGVKLVEGADRAAVLKAQRVAVQDQAQAVVLACQRPFPPGVGVRLVWGAGIAAAANPKVVTRSDQPLQWRVRERFTAEFSCEREKAEAPCLPLRPLTVRFSSPVPRAQALRATLQAAGERAIAAQADPMEKGDALTAVQFPVPLAPSTRFTLALPKDLKDLSGRPLSNAASFPLATATGPLPPLAKFAAAPFGILERGSRGTAGPAQGAATPSGGGLGGAGAWGSRDEPAALPVTMRHVQADVAGAQAKGQVRIKRLDATTPDADLMRWIAKLEQYHETTLTAREAGWPEKDWWIDEQVTDDNGRTRTVRQPRTIGTRELSLLAKESGLAQATLPAPPKDPQATEVIGVPLPQTGYHVVEIESQLLGHRLLEQQKPMYVRTGTLVTNLGVHFKRGRTSSLVWVTTLDKAEPVADADVAVNDCRGRRVWAGRTNAQGVAPIPQGFTDEQSGCLAAHGWFVSARKAGDLAFVFSDWQQGIETWRFNHPTSFDAEPDLQVHTVFDRTLLRAGETVSMKHVLRRATAQGLALLPRDQWPTEAHLTHTGSGDETVLSLAGGDGRSALSHWAIPATAKLGQYEVSLHRGPRQWSAGSFRVEAFKLPLVDARLAAPKGPLVAPKEVALPVQLTYLAGGGLKGPASFSALLRERWVSMPGYDDYSFQAPRVRRNGAADDVAVDEAPAPRQQLLADRRAVQTDAQGAATAKVALPTLTQPMELQAELSFADPNGELQTASQTLPLWPAGVVVGLRAKSWLAQRGRVQFQAVVLDVQGRPVAGRPVQVTARSVQRQSTRKRIVGGFYAYDEQQQLKDLGTLCKGQSDARGLVLCDVNLSDPGEIELIARAEDADGHASQAATTVWISEAGESWFAQDNDDRIDVLPERRELQPGGTARLQVRMPYRQATALVTVEREGVIDTRVVTLRGSDPVIELPVPKSAASWAPNVYVGVLVLRGRVDEVPWYSFLQWGWRAPVDWWHAWRQSSREWRPPTAMVDLAKPSYKFGVAALRVGLQAHRLDVKVTPERTTYAPRQTVKARVQVTQGGRPAAGATFAFAAVDEALLALKGNDSWQLLDAMFEPRPWGVETATAQNEIIGRRHHGRKALPAGGGGGRNPTRELFDTLLLWRDTVTLDAQGEAVLDVPLNDSLTSFRLVAVADAGADRFGTGSASVRVTQDLQLLAGLPMLLREGDRFEALYTVRNTTAKAMTVDVSLQGRTDAGAALPAQAQRVSLGAGAAHEVKWSLEIPAGTQKVDWQAEAVAGGSARDRLRTSSLVQPAVPLRVLQAAIAQPDGPYTLMVEPPAGALPGQGGVQVTLKPKLAGALPGLQRFFETYPYTCLEQQASRAIGLRDERAWAALGNALPSYLDADGLAMYFPTAPENGVQGSDRLTAYLLASAHTAGWAWPAAQQERMLQGLAAFVEGRLVRRFPAPKADLDVRKLAALEALSRFGRVQPRMLGSLATSGADVQRWPTAALLDWLQLLQRVTSLPERDDRLAEARAQLRGRLVAGGTTLRFADEAADAWWWLMDSADANAARLVLASLDDPAWQDDRPRLLTGLLARLNANRSGALTTTTANTWARLAFDRHAALNEAQPVAGKSRVALGAQQREIDWSRSPAGDAVLLPWTGAAPLNVTPPASGKPWLTVQSLAAVPLAAPVANGYRIERSIVPVEQKTPGRWTRGDVLRVHLKIDATADLGWVVISDPVPAGATLLGRGLGRDAQIARARESSSGTAWLTWEEFRPEAWRGYYSWLPRGTHTVDYTLRLNTAGRFVLPPTRIEAMYAPEHFGEAPNAAVEVGP
jgi:uncharacterized protein YfaS (alpha-2-macroglobulin family)